MFEGDERQHHGMLIELDAVNHALCEHTDRARGGLHLRLLVNLLDCHSKFVSLTYQGCHLCRDTKSAGATFAEEMGCPHHNPGKCLHAPLALLHSTFYANAVMRLWNQLGGMLGPVECSLQRLCIREGLRTHARRHRHRVE